MPLTGFLLSVSLGLSGIPSAASPEPSLEAYLRSKGIPAKYLTDGLLGMVDQLRGEAAWDFVGSDK